MTPNILGTLAVLSSLITFILLLVAIYLNKKHLKNLFKGIDGKILISISLISLFALLIRIFLISHYQMMWIDEAWYMKAGKTILNSRFTSAGGYNKSIGWPFLISLQFSLFGINNWVPIYFSSFLGALTIFNIFLISLLLLRDEKSALFASFLFAILPLPLRWSGSASTHTVSLFFMTSTFLFIILYLKRRKYSLLWLSVITLTFLAMMRPENYVFPFTFLFLVVFFKFKKQARPRSIFKFTFPFLILFILIIPNYLQISNFYSGKGNFGFENFLFNIPRFSIFLLNNRFHPYVYTIFFIGGFILLLKYRRKESLFLLLWFLSLYLMYYGSWLPRLGPRVFQSFYPITVITAGYFLSCTEKFRKIGKHLPFLLTMLLLIFITPRLIDQKVNPYAKLETEAIEKAERDLPKSCKIVANWPVVLESTTSLEVVDIKKALKENIELNGKCILFYEDMFCKVFSKETILNCEKFKRNYKLHPLISYQEKTEKTKIEYIFYNVTGFK